jgi:hypothetical protein
MYRNLKKPNEMPLSKWIIYDHKKGNSSDYDKCTKSIGSFTNIHEFWSLFSRYPLPSALFYQKDSGKPSYIHKDQSRSLDQSQVQISGAQNQNQIQREVSAISIFRDGIQPKWEDKKNKNGGDLGLRKYYSKDISPIEYLDILWSKLVLNVIGEQFTFSSKITGIRVIDSTNVATASKPLYRLEIWFTYEPDIVQIIKIKDRDQVQDLDKVQVDKDQVQVQVQKGPIDKDQIKKTMEEEFRSKLGLNPTDKILYHNHDEN